MREKLVDVNDTVFRDVYFTILAKNQIFLMKQNRGRD